MKIDLHMHTRQYSHCSMVDVEDLLDRAWSVGLEGVVLTDHNRFWPRDELHELREQFPGLIIFNGAEIDVHSLHHVVTILPEPDPHILDVDDPARFRKEVDSRGGFAIAAHPFRMHSDYDRRNRDYPLHGVEIASSNMPRSSQRRKARLLANRWGSRQLASSDAHSRGPVGEFYSEIEGNPRTESDLIDVLRSGSIEPVWPSDG